jgi:8-oxo-dGTP diphosphatase
MSEVRVGLGVIILREGKVLLHKRKGAHGSGHWSFPGGHLEWMETWEECAARETKEECGLDIKNIRFSTATNDKMPDEDKHYITIYMVADAPEGEPQIMEPDKCECWEWHDWDNLPEPLFIPVENLIASGWRPNQSL